MTPIPLTSGDGIDASPTRARAAHDDEMCRSKSGLTLKPGCDEGAAAGYAIDDTRYPLGQPSKAIPRILR